MTGYNVWPWLLLSWWLEELVFPSSWTSNCFAEVLLQNKAAHWVSQVGVTLEGARFSDWVGRSAWKYWGAGWGTGKVESFRTILPILGQIDWRKARKMAPINDFITGKVFTDPVFALHALKLIQKLHMWSSAFQTPAFVLGLRAS